LPAYIELTKPVAAVALGAAVFVLRRIILTAFTPILGDDEVGWRVAEEALQQNCWWVEAATFCSTRKFLSAKQASGNAHMEKFHLLSVELSASRSCCSFWQAGPPLSFSLTHN
jgi:hypothetical protein